MPKEGDRNIDRSVSSRRPGSIGGWARHLEGWQAGVVAILIAGSAALLAVPRPVEPTEVPEPSIDMREATREIAADDARAVEAERQGLDVDVRALGSELHAYGRADYAGDEEALVKARDRAVQASSPAIALGDEGVLRLRAFQQHVFLREVRRWEATGAVSDALQEIGGGFLRLLERNAWIDASGGHRRVLMDEMALRASFKKRWGEITGIRGPAFDLSLDESRALALFLLEHPTAMLGVAPPGQERAPAWRVARETHEDQFRLKKIDELAAIDVTYPRELARGVVLYHLGRYPLAVEAFRKHLEIAPNGPWALRAQNYLRAALGRARDEVF